MTKSCFARKVAAAATALTAVLIQTGCSRSIEPAAQDVVVAAPGQFVAGLSIIVSTGSTGLEGSPTTVAKSWWWLNTAHATITATNNGPALPNAKVLAILVAPECVKQASLELAAGAGSARKLVAAKTGTPLSVPVAIPANAVQTIEISVLTPSCRVVGDSRTLYLQLVGLTIRP